MDNPRVRQYILGDENARTSVCEKSRTPSIKIKIADNVRYASVKRKLDA